MIDPEGGDICFSDVLVKAYDDVTLWECVMIPLMIPLHHSPLICHWYYLLLCVSNAVKKRLATLYFIELNNAMWHNFPMSAAAATTICLPSRGVMLRFPNDPIQYAIQSKRYDMYHDTLSEFISKNKSKWNWIDNKK